MSTVPFSALVALGGMVFGAAIAWGFFKARLEQLKEILPHFQATAQLAVRCDERLINLERRVSAMETACSDPDHKE